MWYNLVPDKPLAPRLRTALSVTAPSLWEQTPMLTALSLKTIAPAIIDKETFERVLQQLEINKQDCLRNNNHPDELALLRAGFIFCGVCGRWMQVVYLEKELRLAVRILGLKVTIVSTIGDWPCHYQIDVTVPAIMAKLHCVSNDPSLKHTLPFFTGQCLLSYPSSSPIHIYSNCSTPFLKRKVIITYVHLILSTLPHIRKWINVLKDSCIV